MKNRIIKKIWMVPFLALLLTGCLNDLDLKPIDNNLILGDDFKEHPEYYVQFFAKLYTGLSLTGQEGPSGRPDIESPDEGQFQYIRAYWNLQELPTDEAVLGWGDSGIPELNTMKWSSSNPFVYAMYSRLFFQIALCNDFLRTTTNEKLAENGAPSFVVDSMPRYRAEARFLRALSYWHAIDLFGSVAFVTDKDEVGSLPKQKNRKDIYDYVIKEIASIEPDMSEEIVYGRAGKLALWMLKAKLELNSQVYTGTARFDSCAITCKKIIDKVGYQTLAPEYRFLFWGDNDQFARGGANGEILFTIPYDRWKASTYGGTMYLTIACYGGDIRPIDYGMNDGWGGPRAAATLPEAFSTGDQRAQFVDQGFGTANTNLENYQNGYSVVKFTNLLSTDPTNTQGRSFPFPDTDFPMFRVSDAMLMYAECAVRGYGDMGLALTYVNKLRSRAGASTFTANDLTLGTILTERMCEFYWEGQRRTDLIRYGLFASGTYLWPWKGGVLTGKSTDTKYNLFPIPAKEIAANPGTKQNFGY